MARNVVVSLFTDAGIDFFNGNNEWLKYRYSIPVTLTGINVWCSKIPQNNNPNAEYIVQLQAQSGSTSINSKEIDISGGDGSYHFEFEPQIEIAENTECIIKPIKRVNANIPSINDNSTLAKAKDPLNYILQGIGGFPTDNPYTGNSWAWKCELLFSVSNFVWRGGGYPQLVTNPDVGEHIWPGTGKGGDPYNEGVWRIKEEINDGYPYIIFPEDGNISNTSNVFLKTESGWVNCKVFLKTETGFISTNVYSKQSGNMSS